VATRHDLSGSLPAFALGVVALVASPAPFGQATPGQAPLEQPASSAHESHPEVVITGTRESDAVLVAKVEQALQKDPYLFVSHISVSAENGVLRVEGVVQDPFDMLQVLRLARRAAGKRRVINEIEFVDGGEDHD
jgi:osmotically-inducible protein OsmY